jgi:hypothetical protein
MRATFDTHGYGGWAHPASPYRACRRNATIFVLLATAFVWGTAIAAAYDALSDMQARGVMDGPW